jgi:hypothetical protein
VDGPRYALCTIDLEPGGARGRFHGRAYDELGDRTGDFESATLLMNSVNSFLYEFTGNVFGESIPVLGAGHVQFDVSIRGSWVKGHGYFFYVMPASKRFIIELERLTPQLCRTLIEKSSATEPFDERSIIRAYHARRMRTTTVPANIGLEPTAPA